MVYKENNLECKRPQSERALPRQTPSKIQSFKIVIQKVCGVFAVEVTSVAIAISHFDNATGVSPIMSSQRTEQTRWGSSGNYNNR